MTSILLLDKSDISERRNQLMEVASSLSEKRDLVINQLSSKHFQHHDIILFQEKDSVLIVKNKYGKYLVDIPKDSLDALFELL